MATFTSTSGSYTTTLTVTQTSQSTQNNQSTLTYSLTLTKNSGTGLWNNNSCPWSITIDGSTVANGSFTYDFRSYSSLTLKGSTTTTVTHNSDGTKTVACSASVNMDNEPYVYVMKPSGDLALTTIPRASDVSVSNYSIANTSGSISATITSKASFYHKWRWRMNSGSWSSWANKGLIASTSSTVTVANTTLLAQLPTATSGSFNIEVATYSDSGYATLVGTKSASATVSVNTANIKPSVSLGNIGLNSTPIASYAVAGYSKVQSAWTTTNSSGASSVTTYFSTSHGSLATTSSTSTSGTTVSGTIPSSSANYTLTISAYAKDSRGATSSTVSKSITVYGYTPPTATLNAYRVASSSSTTEDGAGTYAYVTFSGAVSSSVNSQNTIQSTTCTYSGSISGTATNGGHYALSDTQTVTFTLTVTDKVTSSTAQKTISTASYPLDLYDNGSGSVGVGLGGIARANCVSSPLNAYFGEKSSGNVEVRAGSRDKTDGTAYLECYSKYGGMYIGASGSSSASDASWLTAIDQSNNYHNLINFRQNGRVYLNNIVFYHVITTAINADNFTEAGIYGIKFTIPSGYNFPTTNWGIMYVASSAITGTMFQIYIPDSSNQNIYKRAYVNNAWTSWTKFNADYAETSNFSNYSYADRPKVFASNADLNNYTYMHGNWYSASSSLTNTVKNKPSGATSTLYLKNFPMSPGVPTEASTWYYDIQVLFDFEGEMWTRSVIGTGTANQYTYYAWQKREGNVTLWTGTLTGGNSQLINMTACLRIRVFALTWGVQHVFEIDLDNAGKAQSGHGLTDANWPWQGGSVVGHYDGAGTSGTFQHYSVSCKVGSDKKSLWVSGIGYANTNGAYQNRNGNSEYYVYRVDGII